MPIGKHDPRNQRDIENFLAAAAQEEVLAAALARAGADPAAFASMLADRCDGVWVYLRYVLQELRLGLRRPDGVSGLPAGLYSYYADQILRWKRDPAWRARLEMLATLCAAAEPLTAASLARLAGGLDPGMARRWCDLDFRPLLTADPPRAGEPLRYQMGVAPLKGLLTSSFAEWHRLGRREAGDDRA